MRTEGPKVVPIKRPDWFGKFFFLAVLNGHNHEMSIKHFSASNNNNSVSLNMRNLILRNVCSALIIQYVTHFTCSSVYTTKTQYRKLETNISWKGTALLQPQFLHSCFYVSVSDLYIYSSELSAYSAAGK
jgi:hypothetical protein